MVTSPQVPEPSRPTELARLELARLAPTAPLEQVFARSCELAAHALVVERVGVWLFVDEGSALRCANLYERTGGEHSSGTMLRVADFPTYFSALTIRKAVPAEVAVSEPWTAELAEAYLRPLGITSMLDAGIFVGGTLTGVVCHEHVGLPREWTTEARDFAGSVADLLAVRIQSAAADELRVAFQTQRERLVALEKLESLEYLSAGLAHDFRNLLGVVLGHAQLLVERDDLPADARDQCREMVTAAERGTALARELQEFARPAEPAPAVIDLVAETKAFLPVVRSAAGSRHPVRFSRRRRSGRSSSTRGSTPECCSTSS